MLAVMSQTETPGTHSSFAHPPSSNLMREPSAEDLDAARQLVSSARGAREASSTEHGQSQSDGGLQGPVSPESLQDGGDGDSNAGNGQTGSRQPQGQDLYPQVTASLGQTCR